MAEDILKKIGRGQPLTARESSCSISTLTAFDLLRHIPRLERTAEIIKYQEKRFDGSGVPHHSRKGTDIPLDARILEVALDFDLLESGG